MEQTLTPAEKSYLEWAGKKITDLKEENEELRKRVSHKKICYRAVHKFAPWAKCDCGLDALIATKENNDETE